MDKCCAAVDPDVNDFSALTPENEATGGVSPKTTSATEILPVHPARFQDKTSTLRKELLPTEQIALIPRYCGSVTAQLVEGEAEIFGCMVNAKERYKVSYPQRIVLASFSGCILEISATDYDEEVKRIVDDPFPKLVGAMHSILEEERRISRESKGHTPGPRVGTK